MGEESKQRKSKKKSSKTGKKNSTSSDDKHAKIKKHQPKYKALIGPLFILCIILFYASTGDIITNETETQVEVIINKKSETKNEKSKKKKKGKINENDPESLDEQLTLTDVDFIESEYINLGWTKTQGPLVTKRPPRECAISTIAPQVTTPFFLLNKKTNWKRRIYSCIRFGKEPCSNSLLNDFEARRWKLKGPKKSLPDRMLSTFILTDTLTLTNLKQKKPEAYKELYSNNEGSSYINALVGANGLDGSLMEQFQARADFTKEFGCPYNALKIQPLQFRYDVYSECEKIERAFGKHLNENWLLTEYDEDKQSLNKGKSNAPVVQSSASLDGLGTFCKENAQFTSIKNARKLGSLLPSEPLKLQGKLFDVRSFVLIGSTMPMMVFFQPGYIRQSDRAQHINSPFQFDGWSSNQDIKLSSFQSHLASSKITGSHYVDTFLKQSMKQIGLFVFHAARTKIQRRKGSFQLFSVDYIIDKTFRVHLEKTSGTPELDGFHRYHPSSMIADMHDLVQELHEVPVAMQGMVKGDKYGSWELIFSELKETCNAIVYNPCHEFIDFNDKNLIKPNKKVGKVQATQKRLDNEAKRIVKKKEEHKKETCRAKHVPYPSTKCNHLIESMEQEEFNKLFKAHEESFNPNEFKIPKPGEVFPYESV